MKLFPFTLLLILLTACATGPAPETPTPIPTPAPASTELVEFESLTFPGHLWTPFMPPREEGTAVTVTGSLSIPASSGPVPAIVLSHGCGSITTGELAWAQRLNDFGVATLLVHSFGARHIPEVCTGQYQVNIASMLADAYGALNLLAAHPRVDPARIGIMGLSFGGRTALWASMERFQEQYGSSETQFAAYLAFYPASCYLHLADETNVSGGPIRIFHGMADDWIPIEPCQEYVTRLKNAGVDADLYAYPDAHHSFDDPQTSFQTIPDALSPGSCAFVEQNGQIIDPETGQEASIDAACVTRGVSIGYDAVAARQAVTDVETFLNDLFELR
jgi:dienelactone hydrolase